MFSKSHRGCLVILFSNFLALCNLCLIGSFVYFSREWRVFNLTDCLMNGAGNCSIYSFTHVSDFPCAAYWESVFPLCIFLSPLLRISACRSAWVYLWAFYFIRWLPDEGSSISHLFMSSWRLHQCLSIYIYNISFITHYSLVIILIVALVNGVDSLFFFQFWY